MRAPRKKSERKPWVPTGPEPSERELQVLQGMSEGLSNAQIGVRLFLATSTVKCYTVRLFLRTDTAGRDHAVRLGFEKGWLTPTPKPEPVELGARELELLLYISRGWTYDRIAGCMGTNTGLAKKWAQLMFRELGVHNRAHAVRSGFEHGLLTVGGDAA